MDEKTGSAAGLPARITADWLGRNGACGGHVARFREAWPVGASLTPANVRRAAAVGLLLGWFAKRFLSSDRYADYLRAGTPAWESYSRIAAQTPAAGRAAAFEAETEDAWGSVVAAQAEALISALWPEDDPDCRRADAVL